MSSVQCTHCQRWFTNRRNLMHHMASCPVKYNHLELLHHNPLKSTYDARMSTNISVPSINEESTQLFEVETNEIEGTTNDIAGSNLDVGTDGSDLDVGSPYGLHNNDEYDEDDYNPQAQLSTAVSKVQIKLNNLINNHKASLKLHNDIVVLFNDYIAYPSQEDQEIIYQVHGIIIWCYSFTSNEY
jgi:hypothetical protein